MCDQGDNLEQPGWKEYDIRHFWVQVIIDKFLFNWETSFITKLGGFEPCWTARIQVEPKEGELRKMIKLADLSPHNYFTIDY